jgi:membrane-associated phospholipid phosphatase
VTVFVALWLLWRRAWHDLLYWLSAVGFGTLAVAALKVILEIPRPVPLYSGLNAFSFPSGHATMSVVVYGFAAVLAAGDLPPRWRVLPYTGAALLIAGIAVSRLYLGAHWLSDVAGGLALGSAWIALLVIARQRHPRPPLGLTFAPAVTVVLLAVGIWHINTHLGKDLRRYAIRKPVQLMGQKDWRMSGWQQLPAHRIDLGGEYEQPLNIQWAGNLAGIRKLLSDHGWQAPIPLTLRNALRYLMPSPTLADMPLLPQLHNGRYESLLMIRKTNLANGNWLVLHLWSTQVRLEPGQTPIWIGTLARLDLKRLPLLAFPVTADNYDQAIATLKPNLSNECSEKHVIFRPAQESEHTGSSNVLLLCRTSMSK